MSTITAYTAGLLILGTALALLGASFSRHGLARLAIIGVFGGLIVATFGSSASLLGRAKPVALEWLQPQVEEATVISGHVVEDEGIFLTLVWADSEPRLYRLPWSDELAEQLQQALSDAEENGTEARMRRPFEADPKVEEEPLFYASPQPSLPEKAAPNQGIRLG